MTGASRASGRRAYRTLGGRARAPRDAAGALVLDSPGDRDPPRPPRCRWRVCSAMPPTRSPRCAPASRSTRRWRAARPRRAPGTQALAFHALRWLGAAEVVRRRLAPKPPPRRRRALLLIALALLWPPGGLPYAEHTLVDQAVAAAHAAGAAPAPRFVNAVLRRFGREREADGRRRPGRAAGALQPSRLVARSPARRLAGALVGDRRCRQRASADDAARQPRAAAASPPTGAKLAAAGIAAVPLGDAAIALARPLPVTALPGFAAGEVSVQDANAQRAAPLLLAAPLGAGARVLDACAAPGGKTAHLLELADLDLLAIDRDAVRLARVDETLARLGLRGDDARRRRRRAGRLVGRPPVRRDPARRAVQRLGHRAPPSRRALAAPRQRPAGAGGGPGAPARRPLAAARAGRPLAVCAPARSSVARVRCRSTLFCNEQATPSSPRSPPSPGQLLPLPDNDDRPPPAGAPGGGGRLFPAP